MANPQPLWQLNLFVTDLEGSERFYGGLGWALKPMGPRAATADLPGGLSVAFLPADDRAFIAAFDHSHPGGTGGSAILDVRLADREQVDVLYQELLDRGGVLGPASHRRVLGLALHGRGRSGRHPYRSEEPSRRWFPLGATET